MSASKNRLALFLLVFSLLAASAARAGGPVDQETADREGDQSGMSEAEVAQPVDCGTFQAETANGAPAGSGGLQALLGPGNWGVEAVLIGADGRTQELSGLQPDKQLMPASTMKVFTSWFGYARTLELRAQGQEPAFPAPWISYEAYAAHTLKVSDNDMAKAILKKFAPVHGPAVLEDYYAGLGLTGKDSLRVVDGAGLGTGNRASARLEVALLDHIFRTPQYKAYREMLAEPGETGTLRARLAELKGALYAKTGTLTRTRVAALTGFLEMDGGGTLLFSIIGNNPKLSVAVQRARIDRAVESLHRDAIATSYAAAADRSLAALRLKDLGAKLPAPTLVFP